MSLSTIAVVLGTNVGMILTEIRAKGMQIGNNAIDIINKPAFTISSSAVRISLVVKSVAELGFPGRADFEQVCAAASTMGLSKCPAEVGPLLRLNYPEQPNGEWLIIAMDSIVDSQGEPRMFLIGHNDRGQWLVADHSYAPHTYGNTKKFVFAVLEE